MRKITIGYFADGPWSHLAFEKLIEDRNFQILFIVPRKDTTDNTLQNLAKENNIDYLFPVDINSDEFYEKAKNYECDLFVSMSFNQIFKNRIIELPKLKTINCHAGKLPFYRGRNILNWALINDEKEFGITVHYIDKGIDTGDILLQRTFPITDEDNYKTLLETSYQECANTLYDAIKLIQLNKIEPIPQQSIDPVGFYCGRRGAGDEIINWHQSSREIYNFIRAICHPGPRATTFLNEKIVRINASRLIKGVQIYKGKPGQLLAKTKDGYLIKTEDTFIEILEIQSEVKLKIGDVLK